MTVNAIPEGFRTVTPYFSVRGKRRKHVHSAQSGPRLRKPSQDPRFKELLRSIGNEF